MTARTLAQLAAGLAARKYSAAELTRAMLARVQAAQPRLNALISVTADAALAEAAVADERLAAGKGGPLTGIPMIHKDIFCTAGVLTTCGSKMLSNFVSPYDATVVSRLRQAGMVMVGKANMDEFAMG
jgi:aspartyl-tRNA(Asn)/glutamyl-tRNA(Gln) amidotransferase subunit A